MTASRLIAVLQQENAALSRIDYPAAAALVLEKQAALAAWIPDRASAAHILSLARENHALLERAIAVQARVIRIVAGAAAPRAGQVEYGGRQSRRSPAFAISARY
jgi:hypothetical protein